MGFARASICVLVIARFQDHDYVSTKLIIFLHIDMRVLHKVRYREVDPRNTIFAKVWTPGVDLRKIDASWDWKNMNVPDQER